MTQTTGLGLQNVATCSYRRDSKGHRKNKKESNRKAQGSPCCKAPDSRFIAEAFYPPFPTVSTVVVLLEATSPVAAVNSLLQCSCCHFLLFSTRWGVSISPGQNSGFVTLFFFFFPPVLHLLSLFSTERFLPWWVRWDWQLSYQILSPLASLQELLPVFSGSITSAITSLMIFRIFHLLKTGTCELFC